MIVLLMLGWIFLPVYVAAGISTMPESSSQKSVKNDFLEKILKILENFPELINRVFTRTFWRTKNPRVSCDIVRVQIISFSTSFLMF